MTGIESQRVDPPHGPPVHWQPADRNAGGSSLLNGPISGGRDQERHRGGVSPSSFPPLFRPVSGYSSGASHPRIPNENYHSSSTSSESQADHQPPSFTSAHSMHAGAVSSRTTPSYSSASGSRGGSADTSTATHRYSEHARRSSFADTILIPALAPPIRMGSTESCGYCQEHRIIVRRFYLFVFRFIHKANVNCALLV